MTEPVFEVHPASPERWADLQRLFGTRGAHGGCWCAYWRLTMKGFDATGSQEHKAVLEDRVAAGREPGLIGYQDGEPVAWVSVEPRSAFAGLEASRVLKAHDDEPVWSITCFVVRADHRGEGWSARMLEAAKEHARTHGATILEGYPQDASDLEFTGYQGYMGTLGTFQRAGFEAVEDGPRRYGRWVVRCEL